MAKKRFTLEETMDQAKQTMARATGCKPAKPLGTPDATLMRNVPLTQYDLFRLEYVKRKMNINRAPGEKLTTLAALLNKAVTEYLDTNYPEAEELYRQMKGDGLI